MRNKLIAGNWKMNNTFPESIELTKEILKLKIWPENVKVVIAPPFPYIAKLAKLVRQSRKPIFVAAQDCHPEENGAFTGEVSAAMIKSIGAAYVLIGHSERRLHCGENNDILVKKIRQALKHQLTPIFCCGESLEERNSGNYLTVIKEQLEQTIFNFEKEEVANMVLAYEPVWAIGTGLNANSEQAQEVHAFIRGLVVANYGKAIATSTIILYGGSCNDKNAASLFACEDVDGGLIGGASLVAETFGKIIEKASS